VKREEAHQLLHNYVKGTCSPDEKEQVEAWLDHRMRSKDWQWQDKDQVLNTKGKIRQSVRRAIFRKDVIRLKTIKRVGWAASFALFMMIGIYFYSSKPNQNIEAAQLIEEVVAPGTKSAFLTLEDGSTIPLDEAEKGVLLTKNDVTIKKLTNGQLIYEPRGKKNKKDVFMHKITIPLGGQYEVVLPDGSKVWLNSASSLSYPSAFIGDERRVELIGEGYFEISKDPGKPFKVRAGDTEVAVTGTHFNISAYKEDQKVLTTLLEGGVEVAKAAAKIRLVPGQQAVSILGTDYFVRRQVDAETSIAWKNGYFVFDDQDIETVMRNVARWYNVDVYIEGDGKTKKKIGGTFSRSKSLEELLRFLEKLKVATFKKEGRRVTVMI